MSVDYEEGRSKTTIFAVKTTIGKEKAVLNSIFQKMRVLIPFPEVQSYMVLEQYRGYIFVEANHQTDVVQLIAGVKHVHGGVVGSIDLESIAHIVIPKRAAELFSEGDLVEITKGPFSGHRGLIEKMPSQKKEEIIVRITSTDNPITVKIHADYLKVLEKKIKEPIQREFKFGEAKELKASDLDAMAEQAGVGAGAGDDFGAGSEPITASDQTKDTFIDFGDEDEEEDEDDTWGKFG